VHTSNQTFKAYVVELAAGFGLAAPSGARPVATPAAPAMPTAAVPPPAPQEPLPEAVRGQQLQETPPHQQMVERILWIYAWIIVAIIFLGIAYQAWRTRRESAGR